MNKWMWLYQSGKVNVPEKGRPECVHWASFMNCTQQHPPQSQRAPGPLSVPYRTPNPAIPHHNCLHTQSPPRVHVWSAISNKLYSSTTSRSPSPQWQYLKSKCHGSHSMHSYPHYTWNNSAMCLTSWLEAGLLGSCEQLWYFLYKPSFVEKWLPKDAACRQRLLQELQLWDQGRQWLLAHH